MRKCISMIVIETTTSTQVSAGNRITSQQLRNKCLILMLNNDVGPVSICLCLYYELKGNLCTYRASLVVGVILEWMSGSCGAC